MNSPSDSEWPHLRVDRQSVEIIFLFRFSSSIKSPGDFRKRSSSDGGRNPDGGCCSAVQQIMSTHIQSDCWLN